MQFSKGNYYYLTDEGLSLMCMMLHADKRDDCPCIHIKIRPHQRCFNCKERTKCRGEVERGSYVCQYIRYHHELPNDL